MAVLSAQDVERFTPESYGDAAGAPVFLLAKPTWRDKARWSAELTRENIRYPQDREVSEAVRAAIVELQPSNAADLLKPVDAFRDLLDDSPDPQPPGEGEVPETDEARELREGEKVRRDLIRKKYNEVAEAVRGYPKVDDLTALRARFNASIYPMAVVIFLRGWENISAPFQLVGGVVPDRLLEFLTPEDINAIGAKAISMLTVSPAQRGN